MTILDWLITVVSFGCFAAAWAWLCLEADRRISASRDLSSPGTRDHVAAGFFSSGGPLSPSDANSPTPYAVNQKCPVVTPLAGMGNTAIGSRPGRIYAGEKWTANADKRFSEAGAHGQSVQIRPARHSLVHWLAFHRSIT